MIASPRVSQAPICAILWALASRDPFGSHHSAYIVYHSRQKPIALFLKTKKYTLFNDFDNGEPVFVIPAEPVLAKAGSGNP